MLMLVDYACSSCLLVVLAGEALVIYVQLHQVRLQRFQVALELLQEGLPAELRLPPLGPRGGGRRLNERLDRPRASDLKVKLLHLRKSIQEKVRTKNGYTPYV